MTQAKHLTAMPLIVYLRSAFLALSLLAVSSFAAESKRSFDIPAGKAEATLKQFAEQSGTQFFYSASKVAGARTNAIKGEMTPRDALDGMLTRTELVAVQDQKTGAYTIKREPSVEQAEKNGPSRPASDRAASDERKVVELPTFEVMGSKLLNMDIRRTRDDIQPYVTFDRAVIEAAGVNNVEDFLKQRLTMNTTGSVNSQIPGNGILGVSSEVNLRGLGSNKTLILIDGRRSSGPAFNNTPGQTNLNAIPLTAIERIEVLPATSAGIYGGTATGGVVNVILRRDYSGAEMKLTYDNTFDTDASRRRVDFAAGWSMLGGKANLLLSGSWSSENELLAQDRNFLQRARAITLQNNAASILSPTAPLLGATANIGSSNGSNLVLKNGTPLNSPITFAPVGYAGSAVDGGAALVANAGSYNLTLANTNTSISNGGGRRMTISRAAPIKSLIGTWRQEFTPWLSGYLSPRFVNQTTSNSQGRITGQFTLPATAPTNPFQQSIIVRTPNPQFSANATSSSKDREISAGLIGKVSAEIMVALDYTWSRTETAFAYLRANLSPAATVAVTSGTLDVLRDPNAYFTDFSPFLVDHQYTIQPFRPKMERGTLRFSHTVLEIPAGKLTLSGFGEYREESWPEASYVSFPSTSSFPSRSQSISSFYLETKIPVFGSSNRKTFLERLEFQLAARRDGYKVNGANRTINLTTAPNTPITRLTNKLDSSDYTLGLLYCPATSLAIRASFGTGFQPPTVGQLVPGFPSSFVGNSVFLDPRRGNERVASTVPVPFDGNPDLRPEESESFALGLVYSPTRNLRVSLDYISIDQRDQIGNVPNGIQGILANEAIFPGRVQRGLVSPGDAFGIGPVISIDNTLVNLSATKLDAWDLAADYTWEADSLGRFTAYAAATYQPTLEIQTIETEPFQNFIGLTSAQPLKYKANAGLSWRKGPWSAGWTATYYHSYLVADPSLFTNAPTILSQGNSGKIPSQIYHDLVLGYRFNAGYARNVPQADSVRTLARLLSDVEVQVGFKNVLNTVPPFDAGRNLTAGYSPYGDPRLASYWLSLKKTW